jgi:hypothetical protein
VQAGGLMIIIKILLLLAVFYLADKFAEDGVIATIEGIVKKFKK